jgi:hypothetical protein
VSLLREIQDAAVDAKTPLAVVLRKCMILAARLGHAPFKKWVDDELDGYARDAELPSYRRITGVSSIGNFAGPMGASMSNVPLPLGPVPADLRDQYLKVEFREGVAKLEEMARPRDGDLISRWPADLVSRVAYKYFEGYALMAAHMEIPRNAVVGLLDSVRNKALKFALEIEEQAPTAGDASPGTKPLLSEERVAQMFTTIVMGGVQNLAVSSAGSVQHAQQIQAGDLAALKQFLSQQGIEPIDLADLEAAIDKDPKPKTGSPFGKRVAAWMGTMVTKAALGAWKVGSSAAAELLTAAIKAYYGL